MKRFLACLMSIVLVFGLMPSAAVAGQEAAAATDAGAGALTGGLMAQGDAPDYASGSDASLVMPADDEGRKDLSLTDDFTAQSVGIGGHGAPFNPMISPHDPKTFVSGCDMGGLYVTHDEGLNWDIKNCGGRIWDIKANPNAAGTFYAGGSGIWRSTDYGDNWDLLWPDPSTVYATPTKMKQTRTFYYSTDSYPNENQIESIAVDPNDKDHIAALTTDAPNYTAYSGKSLPREIYESTNGGASFERVASFYPVLGFADNGGAAYCHVFLEPATGSGAGRIVVSCPDGILEADRATGAANSLYAPASGERIIDCSQVCDDGGVHYVILETANTENSKALEEHTRIRLWHTNDFSNAQAAVDLTGELLDSLPRKYNKDLEIGENGLRTKGDACEIKAHNAIAICAPTMDRIYLAYRTRDSTDPNIPSFQGINGLVAYDASKPKGSQFSWKYGLRLWWEDPSIRTTPDQNMLMERAHCDSSFTMLGMAADPNDAKRIIVTTHDTLLFSPDIDYEKLYQASTNRYYVNFYPRYARLVEASPETDYAKDPGMGRMRSTGFEVTVCFSLTSDPFNPDHLALGMDDAALAHSYDGGETWYLLYRNKLQGTADTVGDLVFDEGREGVAYASWHSRGLFMHLPESRYLTDKGQIARSFDGGRTWQPSSEFSSGLPEQIAITDIEIAYPRDAAGNITDGERTIYLASMGRGFYVSHDSGAHFEPMNAGIQTVETGGVDCVWARHIMVTDDGRVFGTTQYSSLGPKNENGSSTYHSTQDPRTYGNVWEWDASANGGAGSWVRLPFNTQGGVFDNATKAYNGGVQLRQPSGLCYDEYTRTLYATGLCCQGPSFSGVISNFGGGLYAYTSAEGTPVGEGTVRAVDAASPLLGNERNLSGIGRDSLGRMWLAAEDGNVYVNAGQDMATGWVQVVDDWFRSCEKLKFDSKGDVFLLTTGVGSLRIKPTGAADLAPAVVTLSRSSYAYDATAHEPDVKVRYGSRELVKGEDYTVSYTDNVLPGTARVTVTGIGAYGGSLERTFAIEGTLPGEVSPGEVVVPGTGDLGNEPEPVYEGGKTSLANAVVLGVSDKAYTGGSFAQIPIVMMGSKTLREGVDYTVTYLNADQRVISAKEVIGAGTYYVKVTGKGAYAGSPLFADYAAVKFTVQKADQSVSARSTVTKSFKAKKSGKKRVIGANRTFSLKTLAKVSAKTAVKYKKSNSAGGKLITVNKDTGNITVKRGLAKGTYTVKVKLTAIQGVNYKASKSKTITAKLRVK